MIILLSIIAHVYQIEPGRENINFAGLTQQQTLVKRQRHVRPASETLVGRDADVSPKYWDVGDTQYSWTTRTTYGPELSCLSTS